MRKKVWGCLLGCLLLVAATGCQSGETAEKEESSGVLSVTESQTAESKSSEAEVSDTQETVSSSAEETETSGDTVVPLLLYKGKLYKYDWDEDTGRTLCESLVPAVKLAEESEAPELQETLEKANQKIAAKLEKQFEVMKAQARDESQNRNDFTGYTYEMVPLIRRADSRVLSILYDTYEYTGGAHPDGIYTSANYDVETGCKLKLSDVVSDKEQLRELIYQKLKTQYSDVEFFDDLEESVKEYDLKDLTWTMDAFGMTVYFNTYELAPYAAGTQTVVISYTEAPELFTEKYTQAPENYGMDFAVNQQVYYDVDGDGGTDEISVTEEIDEYETITSMTITVNGETYQEELSCYDLQPVLVHDQGKTYLYVETQWDNDYSILDVFDLSSGAAEMVDGVNAGLYGADFQDDYTYIQALTDPEEFLLCEHTDVLGTMSCYGAFHLNEDGLPELTEDKNVGMHFYTERPLTLKKDITLPLVEETTGEETGTVDLTEGTVVTTYRTDNETFADIKLEDGRIARCILDISNFPVTLDGEDVEEIFDGIAYAG